MDMSAETSEPSALDDFIDSGLIVGVLGALRPGKEATVYVCEAHPNTGAEYFAAKVYRERIYRSFRNDAVYQEGRVIRDARLRRAWENKSETGRDVQFERWTGHEFATLAKVHAAGADVPRPVSRAGPAILMEYIGDSEESAPLLKSVRPDAERAQELFARILHNIEVFLSCGCVHADLSPFNILYWRGGVKVIDFPQSVLTWIGGEPSQNAYHLLMRDVSNVCRYFERYGVEADATSLTAELWEEYVVPAAMRGAER
jgi:RIO kinase 1